MRTKLTVFYLTFIEVYILFILLIKPDFVVPKGPEIFCNLKWVSSGFGVIPQTAVECSKGSKEYIVRVYVVAANKWISGRLDYELNNAVVAYDNQVWEFESYQILTAPKYCDISWVSKDNWSIKTNGFPVDESNPLFVVGRTILKSRSLCGYVTGSESSLIVAGDESNFVVERNYDVMVSVYPKMYAVLDNFEFTLPSLTNGIAKTEIIGQEKITISPTLQQGSGSVKQIHHRKSTFEHFILTEDSLTWNGISYISLHFQHLFGTSDIVESGIEIKEDDEIMIKRQVELNVHSEYSTVRPAGNTLPISIVEICSVANIISDAEFSFKADIEYKSDRLNAQEILHVLTELSRPALIKSEITGILKGRLILSTEVFFDQPDPDLICSKYR